MWDDVRTSSRCYSHQGGVKDVEKLCQLMKMYDGH